MKRFWLRQDLPVGVATVGKAGLGFARCFAAGW